ncbi:bifunctional non-homologous end joining protein LigD [Saccharopolyspora kobensis]|uniref:Bifunctional non-homologous end joining protein LigD n=1 Tax=Saccharopolyspora kobensis TaxID=146035 RepID=A0A1H5XBT1_9PSEU|nr:bifunctional non-homologous end joining protein LigD [Saccharopolyspora kobensis]SFE45183.1 bifunctional non-homologous end joining protein LigD [Saccharopolyspora kobensis]
MGAVAEERLAKYREMRDFTRTAEPRGAEDSAGSGDRFVVQRHRARRRHYDLRLELDGVLVSWAVPKGPTLDPSVRRMAVHVEDHPLEYADFEGTIPAGEYGGGDVIVWDRGTWTPGEDDPLAAIEAGTLHFDLHGEKLVGRFVLVRRGETQWLLLHKKDEHAEPGWDPEDHPRSVKSGRTNEEVAAAPEAVWRSDLPPDRAEIRLQRWEPPSEAEIAALDELGAKGRWRVDGRDLALTNLDKVLFPGLDGEAPVTKRDLIRYHALIAPVMLPYLDGRPLNSHRFPDGVEKPGFWHKEVPGHAPDWLQRWRYPDADPDDTQWYLVPDSVAALAWLANYAALELHAWTSRAADVQHPTWALFDIDPGSRTTFEEVLVLARLHRTAMEHLGVVARPKVTGQRGIQIWVPVEPRYTYAETRAWVEQVSRAVGNAVPDLVSWAWTKAERRGRARLDYTQNVINKTLVAPYSARPRPGAPVSVPLEWEELDDPELTPDRWTIRTVLDRVAAAGDPFAPLLEVQQQLPPV